MRYTLFPLLLLFVGYTPILAQGINYDTRSEDEVSTLVELLRRRDVAGELRISKSQLAVLRDSNQASHAILSQLNQDLSKLAAPEIMGRLHQARVASLNIAVGALNPHQISRLEQIAVQAAILKKGVGTFITESLNLTDEQELEIRVKESELATELREQTYRVYRDALRELASVLTTSQIEKWSTAIGEDFEFVSSFSGLIPLRGLMATGRLSHGSPLEECDRLLTRKDVQREIELIVEQRDALVRGKIDASTSRSLEERYYAAIASGRVAEMAIVMEETLSLQRKLLEEKAKAREELLLPHQLNRLEELRWRYRALTDPVGTMDEVVELTDEQLQEITSLTTKWRGVLAEHLWKFHQKSQREILELVPPEHRAKWHGKAGAEFEFEVNMEGFQLLRFFR